MAEDPVQPALSRIATQVEFPPTPSFARPVRTRLEDAASPRPRTFRLQPMPRYRRRILIALVLASLMLAGVAVASRWGIGAIRIRQNPPGTSLPSGLAEEGRALGRRVSLSTARSLAGFRVLTPSSLPAPDAVFVTRSVFRDRMVVLAWRATADLPVVPGTGWGVVLLELPGNQELALKELGSGTTLDEVIIGSNPGYWISGPHELFLRTAAGERRLLVTGNVVLWQAGNLTVRLESGLAKGDALALADTVG